MHTAYYNKRGNSAVKQPQGFRKWIDWKSKSTETFWSIEQKDQLKSLLISTLLQLKNQVEDHQNLKNSEKIF